MRQVGVIAAAGIVALDSMVERLVEDHRRANTIGKGEEILSTGITKSLN
jgi:threonine aldolase